MGLWLESTGKNLNEIHSLFPPFFYLISFQLILKLKQLGLGSDEDALLPTQLTGVQVKDRNVLAVQSGGQHTLFIAADKATK